MASVRAVLRDIADIGLDPHVAHTRCSRDGRLVSPVGAPEEPVIEPPVPEAPPPVEQEPLAGTVLATSTSVTPAIEKKEEKPIPPKKAAKPVKQPA